jgi:hypothetical protein
MVALNEPIQKAPLYAEVPKDLKENLDWREWVASKTSIDDPNYRAWREKFQQMCRRDPLFWLNTFVWTYNPKDNKYPKPSVVPFISYPFQDHAFLAIIDAIGDHDLLGEKSRDMGMTWMCLMAMLWYWQFHPMQSFLLLSRKEDMVDKVGDPDCLMWKLDRALEWQPSWLVPEFHRTHLQMLNLENGSTFSGESTTGDAGRGGRRTAVFPDEFASVVEGYKILRSTRDVTNCRLFTSTPKGAGNAFYDLTQTNMEILTLHWPLHPVKARRLYFEAGQSLKNPRLHYPKGKPRSPWYDLQCERASGRREIACELDIDYGASDTTFFELEHIERVIRDDVREPLMRGELGHDSITGKPGQYLERESGKLWLWCALDEFGRPPRSLHALGGTDYIVGVDPAVGSKNLEGRGASNSALSVVSRTTGEKVAEFADHGIEAPDFAVLAVAIARWFHDAVLIWESNGPAGASFGYKVVRELFYSPCYFRDNYDRRTGKMTQLYGWGSSTKTNAVAMDKLVKALGVTFMNRSRRALDEYKYIVRQLTGAIIHSRTLNTDEPTEAREAHGDLVAADKMAVLLLDTDLPEPGADSGADAHHDPLTLNGRTRMAEDAAREAEEECYTVGAW